MKKFFKNGMNQDLQQGSRWNSKRNNQKRCARPTSRAVGR